MHLFLHASERRGWKSKSTMFLRWKRLYELVERKANTGRWPTHVRGPEARLQAAADFWDEKRGAKTMNQFYKSIQKQGQQNGTI